MGQHTCLTTSKTALNTANIFITHVIDNFSKTLSSNAKVPLGWVGAEERGEQRGRVEEDCNMK